MTKLLEINNLSKEFNLHILGNKKIEALSNLCFDLEQGEAIGLTGKSGSGKSTLMKCIYRTYLASNGSIMYNSSILGPVNLVTADEHTVLKIRRTEMTYCSQFLSVIPRIPAIEIVASAVSKDHINSVNPITLAGDILSTLNLPQELWDAFPSTFSGGEQQRINIARAIISKPRFLLVDEPTASLDPKTKDAVIDMIIELKGQGTSIICITHDSYTLNRVSDRIYSMESMSFSSDNTMVLK